MTGFQKSVQQAILESSAVGVKRTLYVGLFHWTLQDGQGVGVEPFDDGSFPSNLTEVVSGGGPSNGYSRLTVLSTDWPLHADPGLVSPSPSPTSIQVPSSNAEVARITSLSWTAAGTVSGANSGFGEVCAVGFWDSSTGGNLIFASCLSDSLGNPAVRVINSGDTFSFDVNNPIVVRIGDPAPAGQYLNRTSPQ